MGLFTDGFKLLKKASEPLYKTPKSIQETIEIMAVAENGIFERYLTITIERKNFEEAKAQFATLEATIHKAFIELGAEIVPLNGNEIMKVLYDYYHLGDEGSFDFDIKKAKKVGADFRNDLCNGMVKIGRASCRERV